MTNKLPEVGKRYKHKTELFEVKVFRVAADEIGVMVITECRKPYSLNLFEYLFEEIPDQDLNRSNNTQLEGDHIPDVGKTIEEAKEKLQKLLDIEYRKFESTTSLVSTAQNLLDVLDAQKEDVADTNVGGIKENQFSDQDVKKKEESLAGSKDNQTKALEVKGVNNLAGSIWKDVSEWSWEGRGDEIFKSGKDYHFGNYIPMGEVDSFCTLADFVNQQEQNTKRIEKLEQLKK